MMTWLLIITLVAVAPGSLNQRQEIPQATEGDCLKAKATFLKKFPRVTNPAYEPTAACEAVKTPQKGRKTP